MEACTDRKSLITDGIENSIDSGAVSLNNVNSVFMCSDGTWEGLCRHCGGNLKGFFNKKCTICGRKRGYTTRLLVHNKYDQSHQSRTIKNNKFVNSLNCLSEDGVLVPDFLRK